MLLNIEYLRIMKRISHSNLASKLGISSNQLERWIACHEAIPANKLVLMSEIFGGCSVDFLLKRS